MISPDGLTSSLLRTRTALGSRYWRMYQASDTRSNASGYEWHFRYYQMTGANAVATSSLQTIAIV